MSGHTPGPWEFVGITKNDLGGIRAATAVDDGWVCRFGDDEQFYPTEGTPPSDPDARLIAAAPDLLEAGTWVLNVAGGVGKAGGLPEYGEVEAALGTLKAAIAKAEGK